MLSKYKTIDLCAGIGGIRRGFELTGRFENVLSAEIDKYARMTYKHLYKDSPDHGDADHDLTDPDFKALVNETQYDVLLAGFPCQTFSNVGKKLGFADQTKGTIFFHLAEIIQNSRPRAIFLENVDHLLWHDKGQTFQTIVKVLEDDLGYQIVGVSKSMLDDYEYDPQSFIRNSRDFGVPQNRPRAFIMAFDTKRYGRNAELEMAEIPKSKDKILYHDLNDGVIEYGAEPRYYLAEGYWQTLIRHRKRQVNNGNNYGYKIVNSADIEKPIASTLLATGGSGRERNLIIDKQEHIPGMTVKFKKTPLNADCVRFMTPTEWGKLQGFINYAFVDDAGFDHFSFPDEVSGVQRYKQFGNSVTIPVIEEMAKFMLKYLDRFDADPSPAALGETKE